MARKYLPQQWIEFGVREEVLSESTGTKFKGHTLVQCFNWTFSL
jgi:hypothetical protein